MEIKAFQFLKNKGWSLKKFPALDSESTLVLIFAAPEFIDFPDPMNPNSRFLFKIKNNRLLYCWRNF